MGDIIFQVMVGFFAAWYPFSLMKIEYDKKQIDSLHRQVEKLKNENKKLKEIMKNADLKNW